MGDVYRRAPAQCETKLMDYIVESGCSPRPGRQDAFNEALGEYTSPAQNCIAPETPRRDHKLNPPSSQRQIRKASPISAMDSSRACSTPGTETRVAGGVNGDHGRVAVADGALYLEPARDQR